MANNGREQDHDQDPWCKGIDDATRTAIMSAVGDLLRRARQASGLNLADLAALCEISPSVLSRVERAKRPLSLPMIMTICTTLRIRLSDVFRAAEDAAVPFPDVWHEGRLHELLGTGNPNV